MGVTAYYLNYWKDLLNQNFLHASSKKILYNVSSKVTDSSNFSGALLQGHMQQISQFKTETF
jgi:hypothetical protein